MTNAQRVYDFLKAHKRQGVCDDCVQQKTDVDRHSVDSCLRPARNPFGRWASPGGSEEACSLKRLRSGTSELGRFRVAPLRRGGPPPSAALALLHQFQDAVCEVFQLVIAVQGYGMATGIDCFILLSVVLFKSLVNSENKPLRSNSTVSPFLLPLP